MAISLLLAYFGGHFCHYSNSISESNTRSLHSGQCHTFKKPTGRNWCKAIFSFWFRGGQISPLMNVALCC